MQTHFHNQSCCTNIEALSRAKESFKANLAAHAREFCSLHAQQVANNTRFYSIFTPASSSLTFDSRRNVWNWRGKFIFRKIRFQGKLSSFNRSLLSSLSLHKLNGAKECFIRWSRSILTCDGQMLDEKIHPWLATLWVDKQGHQDSRVS